jgi:septum formation protein
MPLNLILASTSATRQAMMRNAGISFTVCKPHVDEEELLRLHPQWSPAQASQQLAAAKAQAISGENPDALVIGADQTMSLQGQLMSPPQDAEEAKAMLMAMRGKPHILHSAVSCVRNGTVLWSHLEDAQLTMRNVSEKFVDSYLSSLERSVLLTPGAYRLEEQGVQLFEKIDGDYFAILGLPLLPLLGYLRTEGFVPT